MAVVMAAAIAIEIKIRPNPGVSRLMIMLNPSQVIQAEAHYLTVSAAVAVVVVVMVGGVRALGVAGEGSESPSLCLRYQENYRTDIPIAYDCFQSALLLIMTTSPLFACMWITIERRELNEEEW